MKPLLVRLNSELIIPLFYSLPESTQNEIKAACTVVVPETKDKSAYYQELYGVDQLNAMRLPRGFLPALSQGLENNIHIIDERKIVNPTPYIIKSSIKLRKYQEPAVQAILKNKEGILVAPPGAGKTIMVLEAIRISNQRALIIVDKKNIAMQWAERCKTFLGIDVGFVGGDFGLGQSQSPIVIAMQQTLALGMIDVFEKAFGFVCLDECHHVSAETYTRVFESFPALYRIGISATPTRDDGLDKISRLVIGPIIYTIEEADQIKPNIVRKATNFNHPFWSTHSVNQHQTCDVPNCKKNGRRHSHRNNYMQVVKNLSEDYDRNYLIASQVVKNKGDCNLIVSDRLGQLDTLREMLVQQGFEENRIYMLTGRENNNERANAIYMAGFGACAILSTIAKEALDIPRLDRIYLAWPISKDHILEQQIGRIVRPHPDKIDSIVYDFHDECPALSAQGHRRLRYYNSKGYSVE